MKKFVCLILALILVMSICSCSGDKSKSRQNDTNNPSTNIEQKVDLSKIDVNITEDMYVSYINDIYTNASQYEGKVISIEGMYKLESYEDSSYSYVYRTGPGCCGNDGAMCGFEFVSKSKDYPKDNDWIKVTGVLETYKENDIVYLHLNNSEYEILSKRGKEVVIR